MKAKTHQIQLTNRDIDIFKTLIHGPRTIQQLIRHSCRYSQPCSSYESLRQRLAKLVDAQMLRCFRYYVPDAGMVNYYKLTRSTFHLLKPDHALPGHSFFDEVKFGQQNHTFALAEFVSMLDSDAFKASYALTNFRRDQDVKLELANQSLFPDAFFQLVSKNDVRNYFVEVDCGTEPVISHKNRESLTRKICFYDEYSKLAKEQFRVLFVFSNMPLRRSNFLDAVYEFMTPPYDRPLFLTSMLPESKSIENLVLDSVFTDHRRRAFSLGTTVESTPQKKQNNLLAAGVLN